MTDHDVAAEHEASRAERKDINFLEDGFTAEKLEDALALLQRLRRTAAADGVKALRYRRPARRVFKNLIVMTKVYPCLQQHQLRVLQEAQLLEGEFMKITRALERQERKQRRMLERQQRDQERGA